MSPLEEILKANTPLSIKEFMELALTHEAHGYYILQKPIGDEGDFTTAPEVSQMFGELIGLWAVNIWEQMGRPKVFKWVELGPGRGTLLKDALRITSQISEFRDALWFSCVEVNPYFRELQEGILKQFQNDNKGKLFIQNRHAKLVSGSRNRGMNNLEPSPELSTLFYTSWQDCFHDLKKDDTPFVMIANEFLDTLPIHQYVHKDQEWYERHVVFQNNEWGFEDLKSEVDKHNIIPTLEGDPENKVFEICLEAQDLIQSLSKILTTKTGAVLLLDYGYKEGHGESLQALHKGNPVSPLSHIGMADLTAHVDFGALKKIAPTANGPVTQSEFLHNLGIVEWKEKLRSKSTLPMNASLEAQYHRLTHPLQMGHLFKVMALTSPQIQPLGF
ncbi:class I SAM-dependent methyltransferase [Candidatus Bealeia paramacronuclearis]|uniref:Class I SAM-dependent methyltransferase n=1 Tax=Candidatus Bealeia paramacronuclearis TaxID=1921001 RepID=A0ABZ2C303_9PROT|nr:class I SAM-dependent methyltransferase [Candidatus Bealeia paramacronuclearis]